MTSHVKCSPILSSPRELRKLFHTTPMDPEDEWKVDLVTEMLMERHNLVDDNV